MDEIDNLIRDITKVGFMPKSEARRRISDLVTQTLERLREKMPKEMVTKGLKNGGYEQAVAKINNECVSATNAVIEEEIKKWKGNL